MESLYKYPERWSAVAVLAGFSLLLFLNGEWFFRQYPIAAWGTVIGVGGISLLLVMRSFFRARRIIRAALDGVCPECGYDLRESEERCPECGTRFDQFPELREA